MVKDQRMQNLVIIGVFITIILIGIGLFTFGIIPQQALGFTALSIDKVNLISSFALLDGEDVWQLTLVQGGLGQFVQGRFSPQDVSDKYVGKESPEQDFSLDIEYFDQECQYNIISTNEQIIYTDARLLEFPGIGQADCESRAEEKCGLGQDALPGGYYTVFPLPQCNVICATRRGLTIGRLDSPDINARFEVSVESQGQTSSKTFETLGDARGVIDSEGRIGPNVYVQWVGNYQTGLSCPDKDPYKTLYRQSRWQIIDAFAYDDFNNHFATITSVGNDLDAQAFIIELNDLGQKAVREAEFAESFDNIGSTTGSKAIITVQDTLVAPTIVAYVKASWIGLVTPIGEPKIVNLETTEFSSSRFGFVKATIENIGNERGLFAISLSCPSPFTVGPSKSETFEPGQTKTISLEVSATSNVEKSVLCTVTVDSIEKKVFDNVRVTVVPEIECSPEGVKICTIDKRGIEICENGRYELFKTCPTTCVFSDVGQPVCEAQPECITDNDCSPGLTCENNVCKLEQEVICPPWIDIRGLFTIDNPLCGLKPFLNIISGIIGLLVTTLFFGITFNKFVRPKKKTDTTLLIIFGIMSLLLGILTFFGVKSFFDFIITLPGILLTILILVIIMIINNIIPGG